MMNQSAASATRRLSGGSTATAGCCPVLVHPQFFMNTFASQAPTLQPPPPPAPQHQCLLGAQQTTTTQLQLSTTTTTQLTPQQRATDQALSNALSINTNGLSTNLANHLNASTGQQQPQQQNQASRQQQQQDLHSNYSTSLSAHTLPLQHLLTSPHSNCVALAAAIASASFQQHQQLQQAHQQQHQPTPINQSQQQQQSTTNVVSVNATNNALAPQQTSTNSTTTTTTTNNTNQVPILTNFNSYNVAQPFLNIPAPTPLAAHLNLSNSHHNNNTAPNNNHNGSDLTTNTTTSINNQVLHRPLATNTTLNSVANQQQTTNYRTAPQPSMNQQAQAPPHIAQQLAQASRNLLSDETLNSLFNERFQAILINQLFANHQFAPPPVAPQVPAANIANPVNTTRTAHISPPPSRSVVVGPQQQAQQLATPIITQQQQQQQPTQQQQQITNMQPNQEPHQVAEQQQQVQQTQTQPQAPPTTFQPVSQTTAQTRMAQVPPPPILDAYQSSPNSIYQQQPQLNSSSIDPHQINHPQNPVPLQTQQPPLQQQAQQQQQQQQQPQPIPPPMPFYAFPQVEQALALLNNPQVASTLFSQVFNLYLQSGLRSEPHHAQHYHPPHQYHPHLHNSHNHHNHHHGPNGQSNGLDDTMLTTSESKPRGLNRAEIDSLQPYIQTNEKDSRTCVICLSRFELKSKIRPLPCNHAFHAKCVDKWLRANRTCPICRRDALKTHGAKIKRI